MDESILYGCIDFIKPHSGAGKFDFASHEHRQRQAAAEYKKNPPMAMCGNSLHLYLDVSQELRPAPRRAMRTVPSKAGC